MKEHHFFDSVADSYAKKDRHPASRIARRHRLMRTLAATRIRQRPSILEVGCGAGFTATYLEGWYRSYVGIDTSEKLIEYARVHNTRRGVEFVLGDVRTYSPSQLFDIILTIGVLHHLDDIPGVVRHLVSLVVPGGLILANEPQPANPLIRLARYVRKRVDKRYAGDQVELSAADLRRTFEISGLTNVVIRPQGVFSSPFAEVPLNPARIAVPVAQAACLVDTWLEEALGTWLIRVTWNLVVVGRSRPREP